MPTYVCHNPLCFAEDKEDFYSAETYEFREGRLVGKHAPCPECGEIREEEERGEEINLSSISVGKFSSLSPSQRAESLKKRSHEHFEKHIKPFKEHQLHEAVSKFQEASKG